MNFIQETENSFINNFHVLYVLVSQDKMTVKFHSLCYFRYQNALQNAIKHLKCQREAEVESCMQNVML